MIIADKGYLSRELDAVLIWHNLTTSQPSTRSLIALDH